MLLRNLRSRQPISTRIARAVIEFHCPQLVLRTHISSATLLTDCSNGILAKLNDGFDTRV